jgi:O-antigen ligase
MSDEPLRAFLGSARLTGALTTGALLLAMLVFPLERLIGTPGITAAVGTALGLMTVNFVVRRRDLEWRGLPPLSLLVFLVWTVVSLVWSQYQWATLGGLASLAAFTAIGLYIAVSRDMIQIIRSLGDALRIVLFASLVLEIFAGVILDAPIPSLGIGGRIAELGPVSGLAPNANQFGWLAVVGVVTFAIEMRTRSVPRALGVLSLVVAAASLLLTRSPIVALTTVIVGIAGALLSGIRRVRPEHRRYWQITVLGLTIVAVAVGWVFRGRLVALFNASGQLDYRLALWDRIQALLDRNALQGWGWIGRWHVDLPPYLALQTPGDRQATSALNAFLDVWLQVGLVGLLLFAGALGLAFIRSWLLAGRRRSVVYAWPAVVLVGIMVLAMAESTLLHGIGWLVFVVCCVKASQEQAWRSALVAPDRLPDATP